MQPKHDGDDPGSHPGSGSLKHRYLLAVPVPFLRDPDGQVWLGDL